MSFSVSVSNQPKLSAQEGSEWFDRLPVEKRQKLRNADPQVVAEYLDAGGDPNVCVGLGWTLLQVLVGRSAGGDVRALRLALDAGANPNFAGNGGGVPLQVAASSGYLQSVKMLVEAGAEVRLAGSDSPLFEAAQHGHVDVVIYLLSHGAHLFDRDAAGKTLMTRVLEHGRYPALVNCLVDMGANYHDGHNLWAMAVKASYPDLAIAMMRERGMSLSEPVMGKTLMEHFAGNQRALLSIQFEISGDASGALEGAFGVLENRVLNLSYTPVVSPALVKTSVMGMSA